MAPYCPINCSAKMKITLNPRFLIPSNSRTAMGIHNALNSILSGLMHFVIHKTKTTANPRPANAQETSAPVILLTAKNSNSVIGSAHEFLPLAGNCFPHFPQNTASNPVGAPHCGQNAPVCSRISLFPPSLISIEWAPFNIHKLTQLPLYRILLKCE